MGEGTVPKVILTYFRVRRLLVSGGISLLRAPLVTAPIGWGGRWAEILDSWDRCKSFLGAVCCF